MKTRTFREIHNFCMTDSRFREYYDAPEQGKCTREQWEHYYADRGDGTTYCGTVLFGQSQERLEQFLGHEPAQILLTVDIRTFERLDVNPHNGLGLSICARIKGSGVEIEFSEPFTGSYNQQYRCFTPSSERPFSEDGVIDEVRAYCDEHYLLPTGRYRNLQIEMRCPRQDFILRYLLYLQAARQDDEQQHRDMLLKYAFEKYINDEEAYRHLKDAGIFDNLNCDEDERLIMAEAFAENYNKGIFNNTIRFQKNHLI